MFIDQTQHLKLKKKTFGKETRDLYQWSFEGVLRVVLGHPGRNCG
jgi:hypothetical protein